MTPVLPYMNLVLPTHTQIPQNQGFQNLSSAYSPSTSQTPFRTKTRTLARSSTLLKFLKSQPQTRPPNPPAVREHSTNAHQTQTPPPSKPGEPRIRSRTPPLLTHSMSPKKNFSSPVSPLSLSQTQTTPPNGTSSKLPKSFVSPLAPRLKLCATTGARM